MSAFGTPTFLGESRIDRLKTVTFSATGTASYDTSGSTIDLSGATLGVARWFNKRVDGVICIGVGTAASSKYTLVYLPAAAGAPATGKIKAHDTSAAADAEVTSTTDLSATTFYFVAFGE